MGMDFTRREMGKTEQGIEMTEQGMVAEHENGLCEEKRMGKAEQEMRMAEQGMVAEHGMTSYSCGLNK